jgi:hypothetical protein
MALINCKLVADEHGDVVIGGTNIDHIDLYIVPNPGYVVRARSFLDNTSTDITTPNGVPVITSITLSDTVPSYLEPVLGNVPGENRVKVRVVFDQSYSINVDTDITIDIDGTAANLNEHNITLGISENAATNAKCLFSIEPVSGFTSTGNSPITAIDIIDNSETSSKLHFINGDILVGEKTKVAEITFTATQPDTNYIWHFDEYLSEATPVFDQLESDNWSVELATVQGSDSTFETQFGSRVTKRVYNVYYTAIVDQYNFADNAYVPTTYNQADTMYPLSAFGIYTEGEPIYTRSNLQPLLDKYIVNSRVNLKRTEIARTLTITNVSTSDLSNFGPAGHTAFDIIPSNGISSGDQPMVEVFGDKGASFSVLFRESKVFEAITGNETLEGAIHYVDGIIPGTPVGVVVIPQSGVYSFPMPAVSISMASGFKEFELVITAASDTILAPSVMNSNSTAYNIGLVGSILTNTFTQYAPVNVSFVVEKPSVWEYQGNYTADLQFNNFGGEDNESNHGIPLVSLTPNPTGFDDGRFDFEIRVKKPAGVFTSWAELYWTMFNEPTNNMGTGHYLPLSNPGDYDIALAKYGFTGESFVPSVLDNNDDVVFSNLRLAVGGGLSDYTGDYQEFATISGEVRINSFGINSQVYTINLQTLFG